MASKRKSPRIALALALAVAVAMGVFAGVSNRSAWEANASPVGSAEPQATILQPSFADVFERVSPSVVTISVDRKMEPSQLSAMPGAPHFGDPSLDEFFGHFFGAPGMMPPQGPSKALGSGLIIDGDGYIVTNNHVIESANDIVVTLGDGKELEASVVGTDPKTDIALLKVSPDDERLVPVTMGDSNKVRVGEWVLAVGNPFGLGDTATVGIISAIGRDIQSGPYDNYLQIDAPINSGNSGGPVFNAAGEVIGVNTAIYSPNGGNVGIGFAIPVAQVKSVTDSLRQNGYVSRGWLGVQIQAIDDELAKNLQIRPNSGVLVAEVIEDSPADKADLETGDVITKYNGKDVDSPKALSMLVADSGPSTKVHLSIVRDGKDRDVTVRLGQADSSEALAANVGGASPRASDELGITVAPLTRDMRERLDVGDDTEGLVVTNVVPGGAASEKGIRPGDLILSVNGKETSGIDDFESAVAKAKTANGTARLLVRRDDSQHFVVVGLS